MNYGISYSFQGHTLVDGPFLVSATESFVLHEGLDSAKFVAGPVVFSLRDDLHCLVRHSGNNH